MPKQIGAESGEAPADAGLVFQPHADLSYRSLLNLKLSGQQLNQSLLTGAIVRACTFAEVDMARCDLDGMRIEGSKFTRCNFTNVDMRSSILVECTFEDCTFTSAYVVDTTFQDVGFVRCLFATAVVNSCSFVQCRFDGVNFATASVTQNRFSKSIFDGTGLADCTFLYSMMKECSFARGTRMNAESIGMTYGLTRADVLSFTLVYLGQDEPTREANDLPSMLLDVYARRRWAIGVCVLSLNFDLVPVVSALGSYLGALRREAAEGRAVKRDEIAFFISVMEELASNHELPLLSCIDTVDTIASLARGQGAGAAGFATLQASNARAFFLLQTMLEELEDSTTYLKSSSDDVACMATFTFGAKPSRDMSDLLNEIGPVSGLAILAPARVVASRSGSYVEVIQTSLLTLVALKMALSLINGCIINITELRARMEVLARKKLPTTYRELAVQPRGSLTPALGVPLKKLSSWAVEAGAEPANHELAPPNLVSIEVDPHVEDSE